MRIPALVSMLLLSGWLFHSNVIAHDHRPTWVDDPLGPHDSLVIVEHPQVVRGPGAPWVLIRVGHFGDEHQVSLERIQLSNGAQSIATLNSGARLAPLGSARKQAIDAFQSLEEAEETSNREQAEASFASLQDAVTRVQSGFVNQRWTLDRELLDQPLQVIVTIRRGDHLEEHAHSFLVPGAPPLPQGLAPSRRFSIDASGHRVDLGWSFPDRSGIPWLAGDQHLHTRWSLDSNVLNGNEDGVTEYADTARLVGLDWAFLTDHSNIHINWFGEEFFTPEQHAQARAEAASYREIEDWPVGYSQELGLGRTGFWDLPSHMLAYPLDSLDTALIENPSSGLLFGHANCEDEQVLIDRALENGCFGFIAHPFKSGTLTYAEWNWNNGATGWAGMELWSDELAQFTNAEVQAVAQWHQLLDQIGTPTGGNLPDRPNYPTRFPVGVGNSDAHEAGYIGSVFTYAPMEEVDADSLRSAFLGGHCVVSNGPLATITVNTAGIGSVGLLPDENGVARIRLELTTEFGLVSDYTLDLVHDGELLATMPTSGVDETVAEFLVQTTNAFQGASYLTVEAVREDNAYRAMTNPVWLQITQPGDANGDAIVNVQDILLVIDSWGDCHGCPADFDGNSQVDTTDVLMVLSAWSDRR